MEVEWVSDQPYEELISLEPMKEAVEIKMEHLHLMLQGEEEKEQSYYLVLDHHDPYSILISQRT